MWLNAFGCINGKLLLVGKILVEIKLINKIDWYVGNKFEMGVLMANWKFKWFGSEFEKERDLIEKCHGGAFW